jgi:hypothetical protein
MSSRPFDHAILPGGALEVLHHYRANERVFFDFSKRFDRLLLRFFWSGVPAIEQGFEFAQLHLLNFSTNSRLNRQIAKQVSKPLRGIRLRPAPAWPVNRTPIAAFAK